MYSQHSTPENSRASKQTVPGLLHFPPATPSQCLQATISNPPKQTVSRPAVGFTSPLIRPNISLIPFIPRIRSYLIQHPTHSLYPYHLARSLMVHAYFHTHLEHRHPCARNIDTICNATYSQIFNIHGNSQHPIYPSLSSPTQHNPAHNALLSTVQYPSHPTLTSQFHVWYDAISLQYLDMPLYIENVLGLHSPFLPW